MAISEESVRAIKAHMRKVRDGGYTTLADVRRVVRGYETADWEECKASRLYHKHSGEYCELLGVVRPYVRG